MPSTLVVEVFDATGMRELSERLSQGNAHRYQLRDPAAAPPGPMALSRHVLRNAGDLQVSTVAERLATAVGIVGCRRGPRSASATCAPGRWR